MQGRIITRKDEVVTNSNPTGMEYSITSAAPGELVYSVREPGGEWVVIDDERAKSLGIWTDPRGGQYFVKDSRATPEQVQARDKGRYDPRPASGNHVARRVVIICSKCGKELSEIHDFEKRPLVRDLQKSEWVRMYTNATGSNGGVEMLSGLRAKCMDCHDALTLPNVKMERIEEALLRSREVGKLVRKKV